jgi:hypothetical protein
MSANHVERHALLCGFSVERTVHDYGVDLTMSTYNDIGEIENGQIAFQLKATDRLRISRRGKAIPVRVRHADLQLWLADTMPIILVLYDARADKAYWLYIQAYFGAIEGFDLEGIGGTYTVYIPTGNVLDPDTPPRFKEFRDRIMQHMKGVVRHEL